MRKEAVSVPELPATSYASALTSASPSGPPGTMYVNVQVTVAPAVLNGPAHPAAVAGAAAAPFCATVTAGAGAAATPVRPSLIETVIVTALPPRAGSGVTERRVTTGAAVSTVKVTEVAAAC